MAFVIAEDSSGELDSITVFSEEFSQYKKLLFEGNTVLLYGEIKQKENDLSFIVKIVTQI
jgi:DNA polymerase III alpha subunit